MHEVYQKYVFNLKYYSHKIFLNFIDWYLINTENRGDFIALIQNRRKIIF